MRIWVQYLINRISYGNCYFQQQPLCQKNNRKWCPYPKAGGVSGNVRGLGFFLHVDKVIKTEFIRSLIRWSDPNSCPAKCPRCA